MASSCCCWRDPSTSMAVVTSGSSTTAIPSGSTKQSLALLYYGAVVAFCQQRLAVSVAQQGTLVTLASLLVAIAST